MDEHQLYEQNPWWLDKLTIENDIKIQQFEANPLKFYPSGLFQEGKAGILTLRGPRQVGKSTALKLAIRDLLGKINPYQVFFYSMEDIIDQGGVVGLIRAYADIAAKQHISNSFKYIFLDEISFVDKWEIGVKRVYEQGLLRNTLLIVTGSNARDLHHQAERLPGRRGGYELPDRIFFPLSFRQYLNTKGFPYLETLPRVGLSELLNDDRASKELLSFGAVVEHLGRELDMYLLSGGFLLAINDMEAKGCIQPATYQAYLQWLRGDIVKMGRNEHVARETLIGIKERLGSVLGWNVLKEIVSDIYSGNITDYLTSLTEIFVAKHIYQIEPGRKKVHLKKQKKVYLVDPFLFWTVFYWERKWADSYGQCLSLLQNWKSRLIELLVAGHLFRLDEMDWFSSRTYFWRGLKEIDFLFLNEGGVLVPIEVKYQQKVNEADAYPMKRAGFKRGLLLSKDRIREMPGGFLVIPASLFLALDA